MKESNEVWRYAFPSVKGEGWAIFFLDGAGCFSALSDYGDWAYRWPMGGMGEGECLRKFLLRCDDDYLLRKIAPKQEYDDRATVIAVKETILGMRRERQLDGQEARVEWELIRDNSDLDSDYNFWQWCQDTELENQHELYRQKYSEQAKAFLAKCMPRLREAIKNDLGL